jgi:hypothetical protein
MAFIYPDTLPLDVRFDVRRNAERIIYNATSQLDNGFYVFYSRTWRRSFLWSKSQGSSAIGECDFVFVSASYGILCVECKGGAVCHGQSGFISTDKLGKTHSIKDPYAQALRSKYHFLKYFRNVGFLDFLGPRGDEYVRHAAFFPESLDTGWMKDDLSFSSEITGFAPDIGFLGKWLDRVFGGPLSTRGLRELEIATIEKVCDLLSPTSACQFTLAPTIRETEDYFHQKLIPTSEQWHLVDQLSFRKKELIIGAAGTGKTLVVLEYLKRRSVDRDKSLFLCCSSFLADDIRRLHKSLTDLFQIRSLTEYVDDVIGICEECKIDYRGCSFSQMLDILATKTSFRYEILVIDEMQDISSSLLRSLNRLVRAGGQFICCYDPEQKPFDSDYPNRTAEEMGFTSVDTLTYNIRNTPEIMEYFLSRCPSKTVWRSLAPSGVPVKEITVKSHGYQSLIEVVDPVLDQLDISPGKVAVLFEDYDSLVSAKAIVKDAILGGVISAGWGALRLSTVIDFKGMESNVVFVWNPECLGETLFYIACSRARSMLYLVHV